MFDHVIPGIVPPGVIDRLEVVNVQGQQCSRGVGALYAAVLLLQRAEETAAVVCTRQRVVVGQLPQLAQG